VADPTNQRRTVRSPLRGAFPDRPSIEHSDGRYRLNADLDQLDLLAFRELSWLGNAGSVRAGVRAPLSGSSGIAVLSAAVSLAARIASATLSYADAALAAGSAAEVVEPLTGLLERERSTSGVSCV